LFLEAAVGAKRFQRNIEVFWFFFSKKNMLAFRSAARGAFDTALSSGLNKNNNSSPGFGLAG
jgi:hypothetical protein